MGVLCLYATAFNRNKALPSHAFLLATLEKSPVQTKLLYNFLT